MMDVVETLDDWVGQGKAAALATVAGTWGSSPRQPGAKMGISAAGEIVGSVSGGCVEASVVQEAQAVLESGKPRLLKFGVSDEDAWSVGLSCGGQLAVFVEKLDSDWWRALSSGLRANRAMVTATVLEGPVGGARVTLAADGQVWRSRDLDAQTDSALAETAREALRQRQSQRQSRSGLEILADFHVPRPRLLIIGGAHVAVALQKFARLLGFQVLLVDPRKIFASRERFADADQIFHDYPQEVLPGLGLDEDTYVAVLTHDPKIDDPAMIHALPTPAPYVGVLSSRRTHEKRVARLTEAGVDPALLDRIRVPIGLDIGASTPEEIALAVMAEIVAVRRGRG